MKNELMTAESTQDNAKKCTNCGQLMEHEAKFCSACGQKYVPGIPTVWLLIKDFFASLLNLDSQLFHSLRAMITPGKLTTEYFKGRHKYYINPARLFLVTALLHFAVLGYILSGSQEAISEIMEGQKRSGHRDIFLLELDSVRAEVAAGYKKYPIVGAALDSLRVHMGDSVSLDSSTFGYYSVQKGAFTELKVSSQDILDLRTEDLLDKYKVQGKVERFQAGQFFRIAKEGDSFLGYLLGNLIWLVALMMPALALLLKLLYIRRRRYFVEHLVFSFHYHAFAFIVFSIAFFFFGSDMFGAVQSDEDISIGGHPAHIIAFLLVLIYLFMAMRRVYQQGFIKTFLKFCVLNVSYLFIFTLCLTLTLVVGALLF
jgi:hypothetical protein